MTPRTSRRPPPVVPCPSSSMPQFSRVPGSHTGSATPGRERPSRLGTWNCWNLERSTMPADRDELLATLINRLADEQRGGRVPDVDAAARSHPELADELRELWAVAQLAGLARQPGFESHSLHSRPTVPPSHPVAEGT